MTIDAVHIFRRLQEEYLTKGKKLYMYFSKIEKAFDRVPRKVLGMGNEEESYTRGKKCIPEEKRYT